MNYHLALHMPDVIFGLWTTTCILVLHLYQMNDILALTPTNNRNIEKEVLDRYLLEFTFNQVELNPLLSSSQPVLKELIEPQIKASSFSQVKWALSICTRREVQNATSS